MCGRFVGYRNLEELRRYFPIDRALCDVTESYNVAPSQEVLVIVRQDQHNILDRYHWGLVPGWAKDKSIGNSLINARAETVATKPSFRTAFKRRRCLIPADGFYEWKPIQGKKQPFYFTLPDEQPFGFAGLWELWDGDNAATYRSCTIITTEASDSVKPVHHRMPVILKPEAYHLWLDPQAQDPKQVEKILQENLITELSCRPVSAQVNSVRNNSQMNIEEFLVNHPPDRAAK